MPVGHRVGDPLDVLGLVEVGVVLGRRHGARHGVHGLIDRAPHAPAPHTDADTEQDHGRGRPQQAGAPGRAATAVRIETEDLRAHRVAITVAVTVAVTATVAAADSVAVAGVPLRGVLGLVDAFRLRLARNGLQKGGADRCRRVHGPQRGPQQGGRLRVELVVEVLDVVSTLRAVEPLGALCISLAVNGVLVSVVAVAHDCTPSSRRNRAIPSLMRVLTVPSGVPVRRAISRWVRPVK